MLLKANLGVQLVFFLHTTRHCGGYYNLWIADSSKQVVQGQSQAACDIILHQSLQIYLTYRNKHKEVAKMGRPKKQKNKKTHKKIQTVFKCKKRTLQKN